MIVDDEADIFCMLKGLLKDKGNVLTVPLSVFLIIEISCLKSL